jgi:hypothetical protein
MGNKNYPNIDEIKHLIIEFADRIKKYPTAEMFMKEYDFVPKNKNTYVNQYGYSLNEIIDSLNLNYIKRKNKPNKFSDEKMLSLLQDLIDNLGRTPSYQDIDNANDMPSPHTYTNRFDSLENAVKMCNVKEFIVAGRKTNKEFLISELQRFYEEFGRVPISKDFNNLKGYPSRKTFSNHFGSFGNALVAAGFEYRGLENYRRTKQFPKGIYQFNEEQLKECIEEYIETYGEMPSLKDIERIPEYPTRHDFRKLFGGYNKALIAFGYRPKHITNYSDEELKERFFEFVNKYDRIPTLHEFNNNPDYPSFWCYQNRYGSWNKAVEHYGFNSNSPTTGHHFVFENGEVCKSRYEYDVSKWLREHNVSYLRNTPYKDFIDWYDGKKDCDYMIMYNSELIFLEIAGLYTSREKKSSMERDYIKRFEHKLQNLLCELNNVVLYPDDFKKKTLDEMFSFLFEIKRPEWFTHEEIYQGV